MERTAYPDWFNAGGCVLQYMEMAHKCTRGRLFRPGCLHIVAFSPAQDCLMGRRKSPLKASTTSNVFWVSGLVTHWASKSNLVPAFIPGRGWNSLSKTLAVPNLPAACPVRASVLASIRCVAAWWKFGWNRKNLFSFSKWLQWILVARTMVRVRIKQMRLNLQKKKARV